LKVIFGSYRYNPENIDAGSGFDHDYYRVFQQQGWDVQVLGPFPNQESFWERILARLYKPITKLKYAKFRISAAYAISQKLNQAVHQLQPDIVFTIWPNFFVFYRGSSPIVYAVDTCLYAQQMEYPVYGKLAMRITEWEEQRAFNNAALVLTHSEWSRNIIAKRYNVPQNRIVVFTVPASLPQAIVPSFIDILSKKKIEFPLRLLLVGRVYHRKGVDIAIRVTELLNHSGVPAELTVCGLQSESHIPYVRFVGPYKKSNPEELRQYASLYDDAHLLIHPARFEAAGIVPSEAAAFATPTITNNSGGLGTTVQDGISGIVLPKDSPAEKYVEAIRALIQNPERYYELCKTTRQRYEAELNWDAAGRKLAELLQQTAAEHARRR